MSFNNNGNKRRRSSKRKVSKEQMEPPTCTFASLPSEVVEMIFRRLPYEDIASSIRLVSRKCCRVASLILNAAFVTIGTRIDATLKLYDEKIKESKTPQYSYHAAYNYLELLREQHKMLRAVTWRYTHPPNAQKFNRFCFYAGKVLDAFDQHMRIATTKPQTLDLSMIQHKKFTCFESMNKRFMSHFEKVVEKKINKSGSVTGCKIVDILDCLPEGREVIASRVLPRRGGKGELVCTKIVYLLKRSWFTKLNILRTNYENSWKEKQRFMHLRLRRLVGSISSHFYEKKHYEIERLFITNNKRLQPSTYTGFGVYGGEFFYYGNMNQLAFYNKLQTSNADEIEDEDEDQDEGFRGFDDKQKATCLTILVDFECSPELAPLMVRSTFNYDDLDADDPDSSLEVLLKMRITCPASASSRLPNFFPWQICSNYSKRRYAS